MRRLSTVTMLAVLFGIAGRAPLAAQAEGMLIGIDELASALRDPNLVLLHVGDPAEYEASHIPGARFVQLRDISAPRQEGAPALELPEAAALRSTLEGLGIGNESRIVVYFGNDWVTPTTRVILTLDHAGLGSRTRLLDGGMPAWKAAGKPVTSDPAPAAKPATLSRPTHDVVVTLDEVRARLGKPGWAIVDARAPIYYEGRDSTVREARGHIPGARSLPFTTVVEESLKFKDAAALRAMFRDAGIAPTDTVIAYCHIGQQATAVVFAARLIGQPVLLYDGSFTQWGSRADLPVETGSGSGVRRDTAPAEYRFSPPMLPVLSAAAAAARPASPRKE